MLNVTAKAAERMKEALAQEGKLDYGLRLVAQGGGCSCCGPSYGLFPEKETRPEDTVLTQGDVRLFIDPASMSLLDGATIDFIDHPQYGQGFTIENPNLQAQTHEPGGCGCGCGCGCGSSDANNSNNDGGCGCAGNCGCQH